MAAAQQAAAQRAEEARQQREQRAKAAEGEHEAAQRRLDDLRKGQEAAREAVVHQRDEADWLVLDVKGCSERGDPRPCDAIARFIVGHPASPHQAEAAAALQTGRDKMAAVEAAELAKARRASAPRPAAPGAPPAPAAPEPPHVCCCDGSVSPDCVTPHAGCCSGHGGPCSCK